MTTPVIKILDAEIKVIADRLAGYRKGADKAAAKKGRRVDEADRLCEWAEHRLKELRCARDRINALLMADLRFDIVSSELNEWAKTCSADIKVTETPIFIHACMQRAESIAACVRT